jgi:pimeloyl-ACP methyl ester carboxylesterase
VNVSEAELTDLKKRILATKWPERETVTDATQGVQLATMQALARYWATDYDWRKIEGKLNALPQFITEIDGLDIHFIHVRSKHENALPLIVTHGWPGSIIEQMKIVDPLTNPTAHGGNASDAFHLVIPSMPGYGYSGKPATTGWDVAHIARAWIVLMKRVGYTKFVAQGGDWGALVVEQMGVQAPPECSVFTPICLASFPSISIRRLLPERRRHRAYPPMRRSLTSDCSSYIKRGSPTVSRWGCGRRHCTESRTRPSAWRLIFSIMTRAVTS